MKTYTLYWRGGTRDTVRGNSVADAMNLAGYGAGAVRALDFYAEGDNREYVWEKESYKWVKHLGEKECPTKN